MTWPQQSPDLIPAEMVWDDWDQRVKEKQPTNTRHLCELESLGDWDSVSKNMCKALIQTKPDYLRNHHKMGLTFVIRLVV